MSIFSFHTIQEPAEGSFKEKGSKFMAFAYPVESEPEVKERIVSLKKKFFDARHHCFAYILGADKAKFRAFDDSEPNHSAGDPILGQIKARNLTNVLVVVVRYFGGTKLGLPGLVQAYKAASADALNNCKIVEKEVEHLVLLRYPYESTPEVMKLVKGFDMEIVDQVFLDDCVLKANLKLKKEKEFLENLKLLQAMGNRIFLQ